MPWKGPTYPGDFPSLGYLIGDWVAQHCIVSDGFALGEQFVYSDEQLTFVVHHYRLKVEAEVGQLGSAFHNRRSQLVRPQKWGKNPLVATVICNEAVGPALFAGFADGGEVWDCRDHGCDCGWVYEYEPGEPMGQPWPTPLIQITAVSEEQTDNTYDVLRPMIDKGPLSQVIPKTGTEFMRLPGGGRIDVVTSSAQSRLGQRVTFVPQDETGVWTKQNGMVRVAETQRRGLSGMGGRAIETTNAWDPAEQSVAQRTSEAKADDVHRDHRLPPAHLSYKNKAERHKIHRYVYAGSPWTLKNLDSIEAEAAELMETDPSQAERFYGNRVLAASDALVTREQWDPLATSTRVVADGEPITLGFDGSKWDDATALVACCVSDGYLWVPEVPSTDDHAIWEHPEGADGDSWEVPAGEVEAVLAAVFDRFEVVRFYADPPQWEDYLDRWIDRWSEKVVKKWWTNRDTQMAKAIDRLRTGIKSHELTHDGNPVLAVHVGNTHRKVRPAGVLVRKEKPMSQRKIDAFVAATLAYEARGDAVAAGEGQPRKKYRTAGFR